MTRDDSKLMRVGAERLRPSLDIFSSAGELLATVDVRSHPPTTTSMTTRQPPRGVEAGALAGQQAGEDGVDVG